MTKLLLPLLLLCLSITALSSSVIVDNTGRAYASFFKLHIEKSSLNDCIVKFGETKIYKDGDASDSSLRINYYFSDEDSYVTFNSGEMGGGKYITSVTVCNEKVNEEYKTISNYRFRDGDFGNLRLGLKRETIVDSFRSLKWNNTIAERHYENKVKMSNEEKDTRGIDVRDAFYDEIIAVKFYFKEDNLYKFSISKVTTF